MRRMISAVLLGIAVLGVAAPAPAGTLGGETWKTIQQETARRRAEREKEAQRLEAEARKREAERKRAAAERLREEAQRVRRCQSYYYNQKTKGTC